MKRVGNLWNDLISFENLLKASQQSKRGKRFEPAVVNFFGLERELWTLLRELGGGSIAYYIPQRLPFDPAYPLERNYVFRIGLRPLT